MIVATLLISLALFMQPQQSETSDNDTLYHSSYFTVFGDRVEQDDFTARALSPNRIISDYKSPAQTNYSSTIIFKFSLNRGDNEAKPGIDHRVTVKPENGSFTTPVITFAGKDPESFVDEDAPQTLPPNTEVTIRADLSPVLDAFEEQGYYETYDGDRIAEEQFKGVYIAGASSPLSWDFDNLEHQLTDSDGDGIYTITLNFNPFDADAEKEQKWTLKNDITGYPDFQSEHLLMNALYNMSLDETKMLIEDDNTFRTGAKWPGVWTRDISYSVLLAYAYLEPEISKISLMKKVKRNRIIQDTGSGGAWPVSSDRIVWTLAAWEIYKATGDTDWLLQSYTIVNNTLQDDFKTVFDQQTGLFKGESSFLDWREQTYPDWMDNVDISQSYNLGTNAAYFRTLQIMGEMARELNLVGSAEQFFNRSENLKKAIDTRLWNNERKYFDQYLYGRLYSNNSERFETLGESFTILFDIADRYQAREIVSNAPITPYGAASIYPQIPLVPPYHNNGIWPFVQAFWNWSAAKTGNEDALDHGLASIVRPAALFLTNKENFVAENGDFEGTQVNSDRQLWSVAGNLAMTYRVFFGMNFDAHQLRFNPVIPESWGGKKTLEGFNYRNSTLNVTVTGWGDTISSFKVNGKKQSLTAIPATLTGVQNIEIELSNSFSKKMDYEVVNNHFSPEKPRVKVEGNKLTWEEVDGAVVYEVFQDGQPTALLDSNSYSIENRSGEFMVRALDNQGWHSFFSEPVEAHMWTATVDISEQVTSFDGVNLLNYTGDGATVISNDTNRALEIPVEVGESGRYAVQFKYANGSGPWNTDNKAAIRTLLVNNSKAGTVVMAQRGENEWSNWGMTNPIITDLNEGVNRLNLVFQPNNINMNIDVNSALLDQLIIKKLD